MWKIFIHCTAVQKQYQKSETNLFLSWRNIPRGNESGVWLLLKIDYWQTDEESDSSIGDIMKAIVWHTRESCVWAPKVKGKSNKKGMESQTEVFTLNIWETQGQKRRHNSYNPDIIPRRSANNRLKE